MVSLAVVFVAVLGGVVEGTVTVVTVPVVVYPGETGAPNVKGTQENIIFVYKVFATLYLVKYPR